jgi:hypothetical protein
MAISQRPTKLVEYVFLVSSGFSKISLPFLLCLGGMKDSAFRVNSISTGVARSACVHRCEHDNIAGAGIVCLEDVLRVL